MENSQAILETVYAPQQEPVQEQVEETEQAAEVAPQQTIQTQTESLSNRNFNELKRKYERELEDRDREIARLKDAPADDEPISNEDIVMGRQFNKKIKRLEQELNSYKQQTHEQLQETKLRTQYRDFDEVVNAETLSLLRDRHPAIASTIGNTADLYSKGSSAYEIIQSLGLNQKAKPSLEQRQIQANQYKPRSSASLSTQSGGNSPLSQANAFANGLTDELKKELQREMHQSRKMYGL